MFLLFHLEFYLVTFVSGSCECSVWFIVHLYYDVIIEQFHNLVLTHTIHQNFHPLKLYSYKYNNK